MPSLSVTDLLEDVRAAHAAPRGVSRCPYGVGLHRQRAARWVNLVAKECVAARDDGDGVLILSEFAGAARELSDALIINPYDTEQFADAIQFALEMPEPERRSRMGRMRRVVEANNVYRWAARLLPALAEAPAHRPIPAGRPVAAARG